MKRALLLAFLVLLPFASQAEDDYLYILSARAKVFSEPSFKSSSVQQISKGQKVVNLEKNNNWFKIEYRGKTGWISRLSVSPHPPMKRVSLMAKADSKVVKQSRLRASTVSTTAAVRGLRSDGRSRASDTSVVDYDSVSTMETFAVSEQQTLDFLAELQ